MRARSARRRARRDRFRRCPTPAVAASPTAMASEQRRVGDARTARSAASRRRAGTHRRRPPEPATAPEPTPLLVPSEPVTGPITDRAELQEWADRLSTVRRTGRHRCRTCLRVPVRLARLPGATAPTGPRHRPARPDPTRRSERPGPAAGRIPSGCCTPRTRTCPAWPRSASARVGCSTPNWPDGSPACPGLASVRWSSRCSDCHCARGMAPPTGRRGRCRTTGWCTRHWTSRCWWNCGTPWRPCWSGRASWSGRTRSSRRSSRRRRRHHGSTRGAGPPASTGSTTGARWPSSESCGRRGIRWPADGMSRRTGSCPTPPSWRRRRPEPTTIAALTALPVFSGRMQRRNADLWLAADQPGDGLARRRPPGGPAGRRRSAAARQMGLPGPGRGSPAAGGPDRPGRAVRAGRHAGREPVVARLGPPAAVDPAGRTPAWTPSPPPWPTAEPARGRSN